MLIFVSELIFIQQVFKLLAGTYANAHETMSGEKAQCGSSHARKGIINGAQWSSGAGGESKELQAFFKCGQPQISDRTTRGL